MSMGKVSASDYNHEVDNELEHADDKHGPFPNVLTGLGRLLNEVQELDTEITKAGDFTAARAECIQVAAMAIKLLRKIDDTNSPQKSDG